jgi:hypothetical protein
MAYCRCFRLQAYLELEGASRMESYRFGGTINGNYRSRTCGSAVCFGAAASIVRNAYLLISYPISVHRAKYQFNRGNNYFLPMGWKPIFSSVSKRVILSQDSGPSVWSWHYYHALACFGKPWGLPRIWWLGWTRLCLTTIPVARWIPPGGSAMPHSGYTRCETIFDKHFSENIV